MFQDLKQAVESNNTEKVKAYIKQGADINQHDSNHFALLHLAVMADHIEMTELLLLEGAHVNAVTPFGSSSLHIATWRNNKEMVISLLNNGADIHAKNALLSHSLDIAIARKYENIIKILKIAEKNLGQKALNLQQRCVIICLIHNLDMKHIPRYIKLECLTWLRTTDSILPIVKKAIVKKARQHI